MKSSRFPDRDLLHRLTLQIIELVRPEARLEDFLSSLAAAFSATQIILWNITETGSVSAVGALLPLTTETYTSWVHCFKDKQWPEGTVHMTLGSGASHYRLTLISEAALSGEAQDVLQQLGHSLATVLLHRFPSSQPHAESTEYLKNPVFVFPETSDAMLILDQEGKVLENNPEAETFWPFVVKEKSVYELLFQYARRRPWKNFKHFKQAALKRRLQLPIKRFAGDVPTPMLLCLTSLHVDDNPYYQLQLTAVENLSEPPATSTLSAMMAARLEALVSFLPMGVFMESEHREHLLINPVLASMFDVPTALAEDVGSPSEALFEQVSSRFRKPEVFERLAQRAVEEGEDTFSNFGELSDGVTVEWDYVALKYQQKPVGHLWLFRDVTEQIDDQHEKEILARFPQENPNPVMRLDANGMVLYGNVPARYLLHYWQREVGDYAPGFIVERVEESLRTQKSSIEKIIFGKRTFQVMITPFASNNYVNLYATDVTDRIRAEQEALASRDIALSASEAKSEFLATMSHEIRTPLNAILGMLDVLDQSPLNAEQQDYVSISRQAGDRLMGLITNLLDFSRIEAGQMSLESLPFNLRATVQETLNIFMLRGREKGVELKADIPDYIPQWFKGDGRRLSQVFFILVDNALKFTSSGNVTIHVDHAYKKEGRWELECRVSDTGVGIPEHKQESIFEVFSQADSSTTRQFGGSGLGLSIARQLVHLFEGMIRVESKVGEGSDFSFNACFETPTEKEISDVREKQYVYKPADFKRKWEKRQARILVVEDSLENRMLIQAYLKHQPVKLTFAHNGEEAIAAYQKEAPDLILTDIQMPVMDGITATRKIRALDLTPVKIIVLSADALASTRDVATEAGADGFLTKPISQAKLLQTLDEFLAQHLPRVPEQTEQVITLPPSSGSSTAVSNAPASEVSSPPVDTHAEEEEEEEEWPAFQIIEEVQDLLPIFFSVREQESAELKDALLMGEYKTIKNIGHKMRGASATYGFPYFADIGHALESAASAEDIDELNYWIQRFDDYLQWTQLELAEYF